MCTAIRFASEEGGVWFGRNLDWDVSYGEQVMAVPAGYEVPWRFLASRASEHAVIGMAVPGPSGCPLFFDCANDAGLCVAGLNFPESARYEPAPVPGRVSVASSELMLWVCALHATVDEVEAALADAAVVAVPGESAAPLHWMVADARRSIVVEATAEGLRVFRDDVDVLTNEPGFAFHRQNLRNYLGLSVARPSDARWGGAAALAPFGLGAGLAGMPGDYSPTSRFVKVAFLNAHHPSCSGEAANRARLFRTLGAVAVPEGAAQTAAGTWDKTLYQAGFSGDTRTYYASTYEDPAIRAFCLDDVDFGGKAEPVVL